MPNLEPFAGIRYSSTELRDLICPPYDIISPDLQDRLYERDPHNAVRLELARGDGPERYRAAAATFGEWLDAGTLLVDEPGLYIYRQDFVGPAGDRRRVVGVIGALTLEPFGAEARVLPHERTMPGPKQDRLALLRACPVNVSPIYAIYRGGGRLEPFFDALEHRPTTARVADDDRILHRLWAITAPAEIGMLRDAHAAGPLVIADGHHRYETALAYHSEMAERPGHHGAIMCFCVDADASGLVVLPYNRALRTSVAADEIARRIEEQMAGHRAGGATDLAPDDPGHPFVFVLPDGEFAARVEREEVERSLGDRATAWRALDVVVLHETVLPKLLPEGVQEFTFSKDPDEIRKLIVDGWSAGVLLRATTAAQIVDVARSGERMPQKASYFWPKAVTGLVFRSLD
ncbi:MAG: DUF1015 domain-containing protein [Actinomycetota bacterium]|nr:DUF1015 domain-containing protein [Actinomycetota bacterium]